MVTAMMTVRLRFGGGLGGTSRVEVTDFVLPEGTTVQAALETLARDKGDEVFHPAVLVAVNGRRITAEECAARTLSPGDALTVIRGLAGG